MSKNRYVDIVPTSIGKYRILGMLGKGGMGDIYKAMQEPLNRVVAIKVLPSLLTRDDEFVKRFKNEAQAVSQLEHQNIVAIHEYGEADGYRFIAMQFIDGMDLGNYIAETKVIAVSDIIDFSKQICRGLRYAHAHNIVHRDIKPQNILLDKNKVIHITDFGIAKIFGGEAFTKTGSTVGTPEYMSPEQALGKKIDAQSDIYSLGIVMYELLTRKPPFVAKDNNNMAVAFKQVHEQPIPPSVKRKDTPKQLELIILKALKKNKLDRYESVEELLAHLDKVDPDERVDRPTEQFRLKTKPQSKAKEEEDDDRRITDRRGGDRRGGLPDGAQPMFGLDYWKTMARLLWPTWLAIAALGAALAVHVFKH